MSADRGGKYVRGIPYASKWIVLTNSGREAFQEIDMVTAASQK